MSMILSICSRPSMRSCGAAPSLALLSFSRDRLVESVDQQGRLAAAGDAGNASEQSQRNFRRDVFQIVAAGVDHLDGAAMVRRPPLRNLDRQFAGEIFSGQRLRIVHDLGGRALRHDVAAMDAGAGADIDHVIGEANGVLVMLDHDHGIAEIAQPLRVSSSRALVALVQADRGLVPAHRARGQPRADLRRQPDALAFAAGQRAGGARARVR